MNQIYADAKNAVKQEVEATKKAAKMAIDEGLNDAQ
jgi:hypothetical protein